MKNVLLTLLCLSLPYCLPAQKTPSKSLAASEAAAFSIPDSLTRSAAGIAQYIAAHHSGESARTKAAFMWMAMNIEYDIANMFAINFYEKKDEKVARLLATRKGICDAYANTFRDILTHLGVKSYVVEGYTKQNGFTDYIPHAWCAANVDGVWLLYDPTWGAGYMSNNKFVRRINNTYYAAKPQSLIKSHMPFDYLWQFLPYPVTNQEFYDGKTAENKSKPYFAFADSIRSHELLSHTQQLSAAARRIEASGIKNSMIFDRLHHIKQEVEYEQKNKVVMLYNTAVADYNEGLQYFNDFINYRNAQFKPVKPDAEIQAMLDDAAKRFGSARAKIREVEAPEPANAQLVLQLTKAVDEADDHLREMQEWLSKYFSKSKVARRSMFYKITWFGVPLN